MKKKLFNELRESLNQALEHARSERDDLRTTVYADNAHFILNDEQWREFNDKLNAPPKEIPELKKLLKG